MEPAGIAYLLWAVLIVGVGLGVNHLFNRRAAKRRAHRELKRKEQKECPTKHQIPTALSEDEIAQGIRIAREFYLKREWAGKGLTIRVPSQGFEYDHDCALGAFLAFWLSSRKQPLRPYVNYDLEAIEQYFQWWPLPYSLTSGWPNDVDGCIHQISESLPSEEESTLGKEQNNTTTARNQSRQEGKDLVTNRFRILSFFITKREWFGEGLMIFVVEQGFYYEHDRAFMTSNAIDYESSKTKGWPKAVDELIEIVRWEYEARKPRKPIEPLDDDDRLDDYDDIL